MVVVVQLAPNLMDLGGHGHMFCYASKFRQWVTDLEQQTEDVVLDDSRSSKTDTKPFKVFKT